MRGERAAKQRCLAEPSRSGRSGGGSSSESVVPARRPSEVSGVRGWSPKRKPRESKRASEQSLRNLSSVWGGERASPTALVVPRIRVLRTRPHFNNSGRKRVRADTFCCIKFHGDGKVSNGRFRHSETPNGLICN